MIIKKGIYRHYKGNLYQVLAVARHSESLEAMVVYRALYGKKRVWVRPAKMWTETILINGKPAARFEQL